MERKERLKMKKRINKNCCNHYNGTNRYQLGYIQGLRCCKVAICKDCGVTQSVSSLLGSILLTIFNPLMIGNVYIEEEIIAY